MGHFDGRVVIVTGAGRGIGREHALQFAAEGAHVVVNDLGGSNDGRGDDATAAQAVADEIVAAGGIAVANADSVSSWQGAKSIVDAAVDSFGDLHIVVNNAGILRDRTIVSMSEEDFDGVVEVHLKGTFAVTRWAANYWRDRAKAGHDTPRRIINTSSGSGLFGNAGQANYAAAKMGIAAFTIVCARELDRYHVQANAIAPGARTRLTLATPGLDDVLKAPDDAGQFDRWHPANTTPIVLYLATDDCRFNGQLFETVGGRVSLYRGWTVERSATLERAWTMDELAEATRDWPVGPPALPDV
jgi:NAD(P)-dependent dehydrogenase (short-subunit alcohol dehydrogenase family)